MKKGLDIKHLLLWSMVLAGLGMAGFALAADAAEGMEPIKIELPEPFFGGTPLDYWHENLEPDDYKDRPPFLAPKGTAIVSRGKPVSSSVKAPLRGNLKMVVDGDKSYEQSSLVELEAGLQWVQIDLEAEYEIYAVLLWHFHQSKSIYFDVVVQASCDPDFKTGVTTLYNTDIHNQTGLGVGKDHLYIENNKGRLIDAKEVKARYIRCYSNGNCRDDKNHYVEIEVFGRPVSTAAPTTPTDGTERKEPIKIELPEPFFGGLPLD